MTRQFLTCFAILSCLSLPLRSQNLNSDTLFVSQASAAAINQYKATLGVQAHIFNGSEYAEYHAERDEHPYLYDDWNYGNVVYDNVNYEGVPLFYDLSSDELITSYEHGKKIQLLRQFVTSFTIEGRTFQHISNPLMPDGFYELLYDGSMKFYIHRQKVRGIKINGNDADAIFEERFRYYIMKDGKYHSVKTKGSVLTHLGDKKTEVKKHLRESKISFANREKAIPAMIAFYEKGL